MEQKHNNEPQPIEQRPAAIAANPMLAAVLSKYIQYVRDIEGSDFILIHDERHMSNVQFTDEEWAILTEAAKNGG